MFVHKGGCRLVDSSDELAAAVTDLFADDATRAGMVTEASAILAANRGALARLIDLIKPLVATR